MINSLWNEIAFLPTRYRAWKKRKVVGISRNKHTKIYDYRNRK